ncbi:MAG: hypothetical protein U0T73_08325 [Chitinophagales bacterium]
MNTNASKIIGKAFLLAAPLLALLTLYIYSDPFKVVHHYYFNNYYNWQPNEINRDYISFENLLYRLWRHQKPSDYIMGNSRSLAFHTDAWKEKSPSVTQPFHYDAASETLRGVYQKVKFIDEHHLPLHNLLLVCDQSLLSKTRNDEDAVHIKHPGISSQNLFSFHTVFIKTFFSSFFCFKWIHYHLNGHVINNYMKDVFAIVPGYITTEAYTNNYYYSVYEKKLKEDSVDYYSVFKKEEFYARPLSEQTSPAVIGTSQTELLEAIHEITQRNRTTMKILISPLYDQKKIAPADLQQLKKIFGDENVYDFSGQNFITNQVGNYYESSHYKPYIANLLMDSIYKHD